MSLADDIRANRFRDFTVRIDELPTDPSGPGGPAASAAPQSVRVRQAEHAFSFGTAAFGLVRDPDAEGIDDYRRLLRRFLNFATMPFYWGRYEPVEGQSIETEMLAACDWLADNGFDIKGHPLCWHTVCADWLMEYDNDTILQKQLDRIRHIVSTFKGRIDMWDVINEVVIMPVFSRYDNAVTRIANHIGAVELTHHCFEAAREANPEAVLLINDFNLSMDYVDLIEQLLDRGTPIDVIGLQTHQHQGYDGVEKTLKFIDRFAKFDLPLHFTEVTILSGDFEPHGYDDLNDITLESWPTTPAGEERQLHHVEEYYSAIFSRPEAEAIAWWSPTDGGWLDAPAGLLRKDLSPKPAFDRLEQLIHDEWWYAEQEVPVDADGAVRFRGAPGVYEIQAGDDWIAIDLPADAMEVTP